MSRVPFLQPTFPPAPEIAADYEEILQRGVFSNGGPMDTALVEAVERWIGRGVHACTVSSGTAGLELAVAATFDPAKRFALVPTFTFAAGPLALARAGFEPLFVDADEGTWQPSTATGAALLESRHADVAGILVGPTFGVADPSIDEWESLGERFGLPVVIDSAAGFGATHASGERLGARGTCEVFSMHATKMLAVGEGGLVTSRDAALVEEIARRRNFGFDDDRRSVCIGTNAKLPELAAAIGIRQLRALGDRVERRRDVVARYRTALEPVGAVFQTGSELAAPAFVSLVLPTPVSRSRALALLAQDEVESRDYYNPPVHLHPVFADLAPQPLPTAEDLSSRTLALPMADSLGPDVIRRAARAVEVAIHG